MDYLSDLCVGSFLKVVYTIIWVDHFSFFFLRSCYFYQINLRLRTLFSRSLSELSALINNSETSWVEEFCISKELQTFTKQREKHDRKLRHLLSKRSPVNSGSSLKDEWV